MIPPLSAILPETIILPFHMKPGKIFYAVLNMGLGHATRSLPIIREFVERGWEIWVGSNGRSLQFLKKELPAVSFVETPDYGITYSLGRLLIPKLIIQIPRILRRIRQERKLCAHVVERLHPDLIISDHCYGMHHPRIPCYFLTHQITFALPPYLQFASNLVSRFNYAFHAKYQGVLIPDLPENSRSSESRMGLLSGELSRLPGSGTAYHHVGILSSVRKAAAAGKIDVLFSISGPEPQRTIFEKIVLQQAPRLPGKKVIVLGKSEENRLLVDEQDLKVYSHLPRSEMEPLMNQAEIIVARPGYSTLMELVEIGRKALLVPTPGQTEQQYLARRMREKEWFYSVEQDKLNLADDIETVRSFSGLHRPNATQATVDNVFHHFENHLE